MERQEAKHGQIQSGHENLRCFFPMGDSAVALPAQTFTTIHSFDITDGATPYGGLLQGSDGEIYGTTQSGGVTNGACSFGECGTIFSITTSGALTTLYEFCSQTNCADGESLPQR